MARLGRLVEIVNGSKNFSPSTIRLTVVALSGTRSWKFSCVDMNDMVDTAMLDSSGSSDEGEAYSTSFGRNLGIVSLDEQSRLNRSRVAVVGLGGVGGSHLLYLARMGIGEFHIADFDMFSLSNINRQIGATHSSIGRSKAETLAGMVHDINPQAQVSIFSEGITEANAENLLKGCALVVDAIDFFAIEARELLYRKARSAGLTVLLSAPVGFSATLHIFAPGGMTFERFFAIRSSMTKQQKLLSFGLGLAPRTKHWRYTDMSHLDPETGAGPSIASACALSTGLLTTAALGLLLGRRTPRPIPYYMQLDPYLGTWRRGRLRWGNLGPIQRILRLIVGRRFGVSAHQR